MTKKLANSLRVLGTALHYCNMFCMDAAEVLDPQMQKHLDTLLSGLKIGAPPRREPRGEN